MINAQECSSVKNNNTGIPYTIFDILSQNVFDSVGDPGPYRMFLGLPDPAPDPSITKQK